MNAVSSEFIAGMALQILRGEGHEEVVQNQVPKASLQLRGTVKDSPPKIQSPITGRSNSPPTAPYSKWPPQKNDPQTIYEVCYWTRYFFMLHILD